MPSAYPLAATPGAYEPAATVPSGVRTGYAAEPRTRMLSSSSRVAAVTAATADSKAATLCGAGRWKPETFRTYWRAAASMSASVTAGVYGGRRVLMLRHMVGPPGYSGRRTPHEV